MSGLSFVLLIAAHNAITSGGSGICLAVSSQQLKVPPGRSIRTPLKSSRVRRDRPPGPGPGIRNIAKARWQEMGNSDSSGGRAPGPAPVCGAPEPEASRALRFSFVPLRGAGLVSGRAVSTTRGPSGVLAELSPRAAAERSGKAEAGVGGRRRGVLSHSSRQPSGACDIKEQREHLRPLALLAVVSRRVGARCR